VHFGTSQQSWAALRELRTVELGQSKTQAPPAPRVVVPPGSNGHGDNRAVRTLCSLRPVQRPDMCSSRQELHGDTRFGGARRPPGRDQPPGSWRRREAPPPAQEFLFRKDRISCAAARREDGRAVGAGRYRNFRGVDTILECHFFFLPHWKIGVVQSTRLKVTDHPHQEHGVSSLWSTHASLRLGGMGHHRPPSAPTRRSVERLLAPNTPQETWGASDVRSVAPTLWGHS